MEHPRKMSIETLKAEIKELKMKLEAAETSEHSSTQYKEALRSDLMWYEFVLEQRSKTEQ